MPGGGSSIAESETPLIGKVDEKAIQRRKIALFTTVVVEQFLFGGNIFGWIQLAYLFKVEGIYFELCEQDQTAANATVLQQEVYKGCKEEDMMYTRGFFLGFVCYTGSSCAFGNCLHYLGLRITRAIAIPLNIGGFIALGFVSREFPYLMYVGVPMFALGNCGLRASSLQFGDLFPNYRSTAISVISGATGASAGVFLFIYLGTKIGVPREIAFWVLAGLGTISIPITFMMPSHTLYHEDACDDLAPIYPKSKPIRDSLCSFSFLLLLYWTTMNFMMVDTAIVLFNHWSSQISASMQEAGLYSALFSGSTFLGPFVSFMPGILSDWSVRYFFSSDGTKEGNKLRELRSTFIPVLFVTLSCGGAIICFIFHNSAAVYTALFFLLYAGPTKLSTRNMFIRTRFPREHFNRLIGYTASITIVDGFIMYFIASFAQSHYYEAILTTLIVHSVSLLFPLHILHTNYIRKVAYAYYY